MGLKTKAVDQLSKFRIINNLYSGIATIFMLHRVYPFEKDKLFPNENMKVSPEFLENFIVNLKNNGYEFITLDRLSEILERNEKKKKQIIFTMDDGYLDNYTHAYPIFKKYNIPFTIYITTSFPENTAILWWYALEDIIIKNNIIELPYCTITCGTSQEKISAFLQIRKLIIGLKRETFFEDLKKLFSKYEVDWCKTVKEKAMNWEQIIELSKNDLVSIGGHTLNHITLNRISEKKDVIKEIIEPNIIIEEKTNKKVNHFAYPFGSIDEIGKREFEIVKSLNIKTATTTRHGNIFPQHQNHLEALPRIMLTESFALSDIGRIRKKRVVTT
jgi:peptidoglycan/xylan/chitin deacetylase (PgdA/CDA1 family)